MVEEETRRHATSTSPAVPGVNVVGFFRAEFGHGEAARRIVAGLEAAGVPFSTITVRTPHHREKHAFEERLLKAPFPTNIVCLNPEHMLEFAQRRGAELLSERYTAGVWCWEASVFPPSLRPAFELVDEIWVASEYVAEIISAETEKPVLVFPMPVEVRPAPPLDRQALRMPTNAFVFLFAFDFFSTAERKNPVGLVKAFKRAFPPGAGPVLLVKSINGERYRGDFDRLREAAAGHPEVRLIDGYVSGEEMRGLVANADCFVSLHRSEGFGLSLAEAMAYSKPVIATGYSGNLAFMDSENSYLLPYELTAVPAGLPNYPADALWADPDLDEAAAAMRRVVERPAEARERGQLGRETILARHSIGRTGEFLAKRLNEVAGRASERTISQSAPRRAQRFLALGPTLSWDLASPWFGRLGLLARRLLRRVLRPYLVRQREWEALIVDAVVHGENVAGEHHERIERLEVSVQEQTDRLLEQRQRLERLERLEEQLYAPPYTSVPDHVAYPWGSSYSSFEEVFRGPEKRVRELLRPYVPVVAKHTPVVDLGCGRGEFLDLLRDAGIAAVGVDLDPGMAELARAKGHDVELGDALEYLEARPDSSLGAVFCAQVIEHLPYKELLRLLRFSRAKLKPGGLFIAETINPHSVQAFKTFWTDPTHEAPIFPEVAIALALIEGFESARVFFPRGGGDPERDRREQTEFAVVATKT